MRWSPHRVEPSNESEVTGSENEVPNPLKSCAVITSVAYEQPVIATKDERVGVSTTINIKIVLCRMHNANRALLISRHDATICRWYVLPGSISEARALYAADIHPKLYYVHHMWRGASVNTGLNLEYGSLLPSLSMPALYATAAVFWWTRSRRLDSVKEGGMG
jgi:hypothetical protein